MKTPHDRYFRHVFSSPAHAEGELRHLLPAALTARIDWSTLTPFATNFVNEKLEERRTDVTFSVTMAGRRVLLYLLLEHQSQPDRWMALRLLEYLVELWRAFLQSEPEALRLPAIVPMVVYHGESGWSCATRMTDLIDVDLEQSALLGLSLLNFEYLVDDLSKARSDEIRERALSAAGQLALICLSRARRDANYLPLLGSQLDLVEAVARAPNGVAALEATVRYIMEVSETPPEGFEKLFTELGPILEEAYMTGAQILREEGVQEGRLLEARKLVHKQLTLKFVQLPDDAIAKVDAATKPELDLWLERVLTAKSLDEVFA